MYVDAIMRHMTKPRNRLNGFRGFCAIWWCAADQRPRIARRGDLLWVVRVHALGDGITLLGLQRAQTIVQRFHLGLGQQEATTRMNLGDQCVLVVRGLIALGLGHRATQLVQWHLLGPWPTEMRYTGMEEPAVTPLISCS